MTSELPEKDSTAMDPRAQAARLRELLAIPEGRRTDEQWDEIIGIEIDLGPRTLPGNQPQQAAPEGRRQQGRRPGSKPILASTNPGSQGNWRPSSQGQP